MISLHDFGEVRMVIKPHARDSQGGTQSVTVFTAIRKGGTERRQKNATRRRFFFLLSAFPFSSRSKLRSSGSS